MELFLNNLEISGSLLLPFRLLPVSSALLYNVKPDVTRFCSLHFKTIMQDNI